MQQIITTAAELFGERGYDAVSLEDVAERLDVTRGSRYYFRSKDELGTAAIETLGDEWTARLERRSDGCRARPPIDDLTDTLMMLVGALPAK